MLIGLRGERKDPPPKRKAAAPREVELDENLAETHFLIGRHT